MKVILFLSLFQVYIFANSLQNINNTFSLSERKTLLQTVHKLHINNSLTIYKGWNVLKAPKKGIDVKKTFYNLDDVSIVAVYDNISKKWALLSKYKIQNDENILRLKYIEDGVVYFVLSKKKFQLNIKHKDVNLQCKKLIDSKKYNLLQSSAMLGKTNGDGVDFTSRYISNYERGSYDDTRVLLLYPKLKLSTKDKKYKYGPANPKVAFLFTKDYEGKDFYVYDYKFSKCYYGVFPSMKIPPFPMLREIK